MRIKAVIWDLDGTLLDTLKDLTLSTNRALAACGLPRHDLEEVRSFVGNGARKLIERAVPDGAENPLFDRVMETYIADYAVHSMDHTGPYPGVPELLDTLTSLGVRHAVVSNKHDSAVGPLVRMYFGDRFEAAAGNRPDQRCKPAPDSVLAVMERMGLTPETTVYIGDSDVDIRTAENAGLTCISVTWGFRSESFLRENGASHIAHTPEDVLRIIRLL